MKILVVCENYYPHAGGAEVLLKNLAQGYVKQGHTVTVVTHKFPHTPKTENHQGVTIKRVASANSRYLFSFTGMYRAFKEAKNTDIIQTTTFNGAFPAWFAAKMRRKPVVLIVHEVWIGKWQKITGFGWLKSTIHNLLERLIYVLNYDVYVCVSDATKRDLLTQDIPPSKVQRIYNGFDDTTWHPEKFSKDETAKLRQQYKANNEFLFFAWGRPGASKGFEILIDAMEQLSKKHPQARLLLRFGSPESYQQRYDALCKKMRDLKLEPYISIANSIPYEKLGNCILAADCVVIPSLAEGFGYTTLETVNLSTPVITSDAGSLPEVVSGKHRTFKTGSVPSLVQAMEHAMKGEFQQTPKKSFPWNETIKQYLLLYERLLTK